MCFVLHFHVCASSCFVPRASVCLGPPQSRIVSPTKKHVLDAKPSRVKHKVIRLNKTNTKTTKPQSCLQGFCFGLLPAEAKAQPTFANVRFSHLGVGVAPHLRQVSLQRRTTFSFAVPTASPRVCSRRSSQIDLFALHCTYSLHRTLNNHGAPVA